MADADRDEKVTQAYRALGGEEPPRALDEAILAASRRRPARWRVPLSIAAVLVLAVGVTLRMLPPQPDAESVALAPQVIETPKPRLAEAPARPADARPAVEGASRAAPSAPVALERTGRADEVAASAASAAPAAGAMRSDAAAAGEGRARALAAAPSAAGAPAAAKNPESALTPEAWLKRIAELRKQGREREAQESLAEFKKRYPDYKLPETLR